MQNKKIIKLIHIPFLLLATSGFIGKNESFEEALKRSRKPSLTYAPEVKSGLPYFTHETLTPTWVEEKAVKIPLFSLVNQDGKKMTEKLFENKISIVSFIFTSCAGFCPLLVSKLQSIEAKLGRPNNVQFIVISVDPEVDTPKKLREYGKSRMIIKDNWTLLTGEKHEVYELSRKTFASEIRKIDSKNMRKFAHTEHFYLIDQDRKIRAILNGTRKDLLQQSIAAVSELRN